MRFESRSLARRSKATSRENGPFYARDEIWIVCYNLRIACISVREGCSSAEEIRNAKFNRRDGDESI